MKEYRRELASKSYSTVEEYASNFFEYLSQLVKNMPTESLQAQVLTKAQWELSMLAEAVKEFQEEENNRVSSQGMKEIEDKLASLIEARIGELKIELEHHEPVEGVSRSFVTQQVNALLPDWSSIVRIYLVGLPISDKICRRTKDMITYSLQAISYKSPFSSGIVLAGFGKKEWFPSLYHYLVDGFIVGKVLRHEVEVVHVDEVRNAAICAFAQSDMAITFMDGLHPTYSSALDDYHIAVFDFFNEMLLSLLQHIEKEFKVSISVTERFDLLERMKQAGVDGLTVLKGRLDSIMQHHPSQIMSVVKWLPKEELAEIAEALVNLTSFKRRVTPEAETVGGPIDVAVISKGDGLVWIKRKHYFESDLNHQYFHRNRRLSSP